MDDNKNLYSNLTHFLSCKDYAFSKENFELYYHSKYDFLATKPVPKNLAEYYKSENYISHTDSKKSFLDKIYQIVKNYTLKQKLSLINSFQTAQKTILDVGAGTGDFLKVCKSNDWKIFGIEPSLIARESAQKKGLFLNENTTELSGKKYDVITLWHVLEHVHNLQDYTLTLKNLLKEDGKLVIAVPNYKSYDANYYKEHWAAFDVPRHVWHFSQKSIQLLFSDVSMEVEKVLPMKFDAFYVSLLSEKYKRSKMSFVKAVYRGFISNLKAKRTSEYSSLIYIIKNKK
ncbi:class I SAM-dependent methyltransferase [Polaribacter tangerinus]|uniref:class I SAM-dependent methyltransferase n=1 Tax=Polaribacter tangerinus TaxID=1920034 RepID=UPI000B4B7FBF|nr:class I SAM-dependent methyltransferase [Polaribacter tangerinus]